MESTLQVLTECSTSGAGPLKGANNSAGLKWCFSFSPADEGDVYGGEMRLKGKGSTSERYWPS